MKANKYPANPILFVDDEAQFLESGRIVLSSSSINNVVVCQDSRKVLQLCKENNFEAMLLDINMPHISGKELLNKLIQDFPNIPVIILTGMDETETAVECMRNGAFDYMVKPVEESRLVSGVKRAIEIRDLQQENSRLKNYLLSDNLEHPEAFSKIVTKNNAMRSIFQYIESIARTSRPVLISGETGVGKELIAKSIHSLSRREGNFVPVNAGGLDDTIFSDTLFGHKKGAFTSAEQSRKGLIEQASGGTLFLDEIGDLEPISQVKLLRLLQEGEYYPLGSDVPNITDTRIVVSTNRDLRALQEKGKFRRDLYYRLSAHYINIPPLRERLDDLPLLVDSLLEEASKALEKKKPAYPRELLILLSTYSFPGNVRELQGLIFDAVSRHSRSMLSMNSFKQYIAKERVSDGKDIDQSPNLENGMDINLTISKNGRLPTLKEAEHYLINEAMKRSNENQTIAAEMLGLTRPALNKRLNRTT